ncbi:SAM-dependent methyltransferase [Streptomyces coffeae]|uniref:SAM-dependent methyltransferase n=1 Tax=Streptomyces coffeae TaxID=621382 RepID=A0ABS1N8S0_9ACTN|nr:SAM-dependent methyltransferase [Streptomyces coffeae]MBL1096428.1 SAM-dependent methyltransferase [Streptomyces coffeae]
MTDQHISAEEIDTSRPHPARMYDYYLGGWDNYEIDREAADRIIAVSPDIVDSARANRDFMVRAVRAVAAAGVRQIIDIGTGIPTSPNTHEVAREIAPDTRVVYLDNDPIVAAHADAKLTGTPGTGLVLADARAPDKILADPVVRELIDFSQPVALLLVAVLHFVTDEEDPAGLVNTLTQSMTCGSHLVISHGTTDFHGRNQVADEVYRKSTARLSLRRHDEILPFFGGFELLDPGLVRVSRWRPDPAAAGSQQHGPIGVYGGVGRRR